MMNMVSNFLKKSSGSSWCFALLGSESLLAISVAAERLATDDPVAVVWTVPVRCMGGEELEDWVNGLLRAQSV